MKTEPVFNDEFGGENSNGSIENNDSLAVFCPRCSAMFVTQDEMLQHYHQEMNHLLTLELTRRRILDLCKHNTQFNLHHSPIPQPISSFPFQPFMFPPPMPLMFNNTAPPFPPLFDLGPENVNGCFHDHEMTAIFPTPPPPPPPSPERDTNITLDFLSFMDQPAAPTMDQRSLADIVDAEHMGTVVSVPVSVPVADSVPAVFAPPPSAVAPEAAKTELALAPPVMAPAAVSIKREDSDEVDLNLKL